MERVEGVKALIDRYPIVEVLLDAIRERLLPQEAAELNKFPVFLDTDELGANVRGKPMLLLQLLRDPDDTGKFGALFVFVPEGILADEPVEMTSRMIEKERLINGTILGQNKYLSDLVMISSTRVAAFFGSEGVSLSVDTAWYTEESLLWEDWRG